MEGRSRTLLDDNELSVFFSLSGHLISLSLPRRCSLSPSKLWPNRVVNMNKN